MDWVDKQQEEGDRSRMPTSLKKRFPPRPPPWMPDVINVL